ncbi:AAA family ATPase [Polyangium sorediatum]|uniref:AAA family ATPase n=1 Tax=Polyangium sorediatum TaxID=889274 RepID=A0ABT6P982_9BACT|nr:ATP-binding protein [Polyangium sorediatum]MDI1437167.1 AAA family ATPase [Polyangium sorediatum]
MFQSIEIEQFRGFSRLALSDLGRVNLVVGKNNTGKTSLLEAITVLADPATMGDLHGLFRTGGGVPDARFYHWLPKHGADVETVLRVTSPGQKRRRVFVSRKGRLSSSEGEKLDSFYQGNSLYGWCTAGVLRLRVHAVSVQHRVPDAMVDAFAEAVRAPEDEQQLESLLGAVDSRIRSVRLDAVAAKPFIVVDVGLRERIPLSQAGQGIYRLVAIFSELLGRKPDICFIDEIENGIHYTALPTVWKGIAEVSERLGIQVFATTHSRECLVAAHECFAARESYDFRVVQLYRLHDAVDGRTLDRKHIEAAIAGDIELR